MKLAQIAEELEIVSDEHQCFFVEKVRKRTDTHGFAQICTDSHRYAQIVGETGQSCLEIRGFCKSADGSGKKK